MRPLNFLERWANRNPVLAVWLGAVLFLVVLFTAAAIHVNTRG